MSDRLIIASESYHGGRVYGESDSSCSTRPFRSASMTNNVLMRAYGR
jgi:hypothetical protein